MSKVEHIEKQVQSHFVEFDWAMWDRQFERDAARGKLDAFAKRALRDHASGKTTPL